MKIISALALVLACCACNQESKNEGGSEYMMPAVENVNGNIPDTSNTINLNSSLPVDTTNYDTTTRKP